MNDREEWVSELDNKNELMKRKKQKRKERQKDGKTERKRKEKEKLMNRYDR